MTGCSALRIELLADHPECLTAVGEMRWREWGHPPEPVDRAFWLDTTAAEAGRDTLPVTLVALDDSGAALGAVALAAYDLEERREVSPWVVGTIVRRDRRGQGVGQALLAHLEQWGASRRHPEAWVATGRAQGFYQRCGWAPVEDFTNQYGERVAILHKRLT